MDCPSNMFISFSDAVEMRICGRSKCGRKYKNCTPLERRHWRIVNNSRNTTGDVSRWVCGECLQHYADQGLSYRRGAKYKTLTSILFIDSSTQRISPIPIEETVTRMTWGSSFQTLREEEVWPHNEKARPQQWGQLWIFLGNRVPVRAIGFSRDVYSSSGKSAPSKGMCCSG